MASSPTSSQPFRPDGYLWRRHDWGVPYKLGLAVPRAFWRLCPTLDEGQFPTARRWESLEKAFVGFALRHGSPAVAVYDYAGVLGKMLEDGFYKIYNPELDQVSAIEQVKHSFLSVWMGDCTPFLCSVERTYFDTVASALRRLSP